MDVETQDTVADATKAYWDRFYAQAGLGDASTFCRYIAESSYLRPHVIDLGCGNGRDTFAFSKHSTTVVGVDQSEVATETSNARVAKDGINGLSFRQSELQDVEAIENIVSHVRPTATRGILFYCRFVLHAIEEDAQHVLLSTLKGLLHEGDVFAAEFRTAKDKLLDHVHGDHFRRYQDPTILKADLPAKYGMKVVVYQEGNGFSPYKGEDPELCRLIAVPA